jgi:drug/metabolite transporter (DMT)-like permease
MTWTASFPSVLCFIVAAFFGAVGQYLYKSGADAADATVAGYLLNPRLIAGLVCYAVVMVLFVLGFRLGGRMTLLYPIYASTFIWAAIIAWRVYGTPITATNVAGMVAIVAGMYLMGKQA